MNKTVLLLFISFFISGCTTLGVGTAELTGIALFHDRRTAETIITDEKIENDAMLTLNLNSDIRPHSHFNVTAYNGIALITGETVMQAVADHITETVQRLNDVRLVQNEMLLTAPSAYSSRLNDSMITTKVKTSLSEDPRLPGFDTTRIKVVTEKGRVFLMGMVYPQEGDIAAEIARRQPGVQEVVKVFEYLYYQ
jgi:osmotically-inducible protein OsmY